MAFTDFKIPKLLLVLCILLSLQPAAILAQEPSEISPDQFILPWAAGQSFFITWGPYEHWAAGKQIGFSVDFALPEGTPLYAPATGEASFLTDDRPYQYGLGNYIDLVCGRWKIRLAHLRDSLTGIRLVEQGEFLGYSGSSGASAPHLHLELLILRDSQWVAAQESDLSSFFGIPLIDLVEGAVATNINLTHSLTWASEPTVVSTTVKLGQDATFRFPFINTSELMMTISLVQVALIAPDGSSRLAQTSGDWTIAPGAITTIQMAYSPDMSGLWQLRKVTGISAGQTWQLPLDGQWNVEPPAIGVVGVAMSATLEIGQRAPMDLWLENRSSDELVYEHLILEGQQPDGSTWRLEINEPTYIPPYQVVCLHLLSPYTSQTGQWLISRLVENVDQHTFSLGAIEQSFIVEGPRLIIETLGLRGTQSLYVMIRNIGTRSAKADWLEVLGTSAASGHTIAARTSSLRDLSPGEATTLVLVLPKVSDGHSWNLIAGGYWLEGSYYIMPLPDPYLYNGTPN